MSQEGCGGTILLHGDIAQVYKGYGSSIKLKSKRFSDNWSTTLMSRLVKYEHSLLPSNDESLQGLPRLHPNGLAHKNNPLNLVDQPRTLS